MDYVLFGMGYGASLMLLGWALRTFGPQLKYTRPPREEDPDFLVQQRFWVRFVQGLGGVIAIAGTTMVLMTFVVVLVNPVDETGMTMAMAIWGFILIIVLIWCWLYLSRFGLTGIWSRASGYGFRSKEPAAKATGELARDIAPRANPGVNHELLVTIDEHAVAPAVQLEPAAEPAPVVEESAIVAGAPASPDDPNDTNVTPTDPEYDFGDGTETTVPSEAGGRANALRRLRERQMNRGDTTS